MAIQVDGPVMDTLSHQDAGRKRALGQQIFALTDSAVSAGWSGKGYQHEQPNEDRTAQRANDFLHGAIRYLQIPVCKWRTSKH